MGGNALEAVHLGFVGIAQVPKRALDMLARRRNNRGEACRVHLQLVAGQRSHAQVLGPGAAELHLIEVHV